MCHVVSQLRKYQTVYLGVSTGCQVPITLWPFYIRYVSLICLLSDRGC